MTPTFEDPTPVAAPRLRGPITYRMWRRTTVVALSLWLFLAGGPHLLHLPAPWHAFAAGLAVPGAGLLYSMPSPHHHVDASDVTVHAVLLVAAVVVIGWALRDRAAVAAGAVCAILAGSVFTALMWPAAIVMVGHIAGFFLVAGAAGWALVFRAIARSDYLTLPALVVGFAGLAALLSISHASGAGPLTWVSWGAPVVAIVVTLIIIGREWIRHRSARRVGRKREQYLEQCRAVRPHPVRTASPPLRHEAALPAVTEADDDQLRLLRYLTNLAMQPPNRWDGFDDEGAGPLQQYRYQLNAVGWALSMFGYSHTPAYWGALHQAQVALFTRMQDPRVWGYWYRQNLLGNWDFRQRRADPIGVPQNIMFSGYLNLQLAMFRQATGDTRFDHAESFRFQRSPAEAFEYNHTEINDTVVRNFDSELCLWPCEPVPIGRGRRHGLVFPYCNAVAAAGVAVLDALNGTDHSAEIAFRLRHRLATEFTAADGDIVTFVVSGLGLTARGFRGPASTAAIAAFIAPLLPELAWRAWEILRNEWLDTGAYVIPTSGGKESPTASDWGTGALTNAEPLAAALLLAQECGESSWRTALWQEATRQLDFLPSGLQPAMFCFNNASVHANGMLGLGGLGRQHALTDMMTLPRPPEWTSGPRILAAPYPAVMVAKAVSDGAGLDAVFRPGHEPGRFTIRIDQLQPRREYRVIGATESSFSADERGRLDVTLDINDRATLMLRPTW